MNVYRNALIGAALWGLFVGLNGDGLSFWVMVKQAVSIVVGFGAICFTAASVLDHRCSSSKREALEKQ